MAGGNSNLGHFLTFSLWEQALALLNFQVACQEDNRYFKTLSMIYYKELDSSVEALETKEYFEDKVASNLFYGLEKEFAVHPYTIPKSRLGLRNYKFFTYPMRALYYAIGIYLLNLSQDFLDNFVNAKARHRVRSFYGGKLRFEGDELKFNSNSVYFRTFYKKFRNRVRHQISGEVDRKMVIRLDIQNFFDEISIPILLDLLDAYIKPSQKANLSFDANTREQISFFFRFIANGGKGIPQSDCSIVSSFLGYLYLVFGDLFIEEELRKHDGIVDGYLFTRYVDDMFISITFKDEVSSHRREQYVVSLGSRIADILYRKLGLRLNPKTRFFCLEDEEQLRALRSSLKKVSPEYHVSDDRDDESPSNKIENIFDELDKLKRGSIKPETFGHDLQDEILKEVFDKRVRQMLEIESNKERIREIFADFDFNRVKRYPLPILIIILKDPDTTERFRQFLLDKQNLSTWDVGLILDILCQVDFQDQDLLGKLQDYEPMRDIVEDLERSNLPVSDPGYYGLSSEKPLLLSEMPYIVEQIRHRVYSERTQSYSVALNHLLNEVHAICYERDSHSDHGRYRAPNVIDFLDSQGVPISVCANIRNLFDRRNHNQISHPGSDENTTWSVTKEEYYRYHSHVGKCLRALMNNGQVSGNNEE
jgi:AbiA family abortive infection protein